MGSKQTTLDLNGPFIEFTSSPEGVVACPGDSISLSGIATVYFLDEPSGTPINPAVATGSLSYQWYEISDGSYIPLSNSTTISGAATTSLIISDIDETYNGKQIVIGADYVPSAYAQPEGSAVTVGTARSTGNAINEILYSSPVTITVRPTISISKQPSDVEVGTGISATFSITASATDNSALAYQWYADDVALSNSTTVSGSNTDTLTIRYDTETTKTIYCRVFSTTACNSPIQSSSVTLNVVIPRKLINIEYINNNGGASETARLVNIDLTTGSYQFAPVNSSSLGPEIISFYAPERDVEVIMDIYSSAGSNNGGQGGVSSIKFKMDKNVEYVIGPYRDDRISSVESVFLYRKARLIACVGAGGNGGRNGAGGRGGGVDVAGENGFGSGAGAGGIRYAPGTLPSTGIVGSISTQPGLCCGDVTTSAPNGGRVLPCARGDSRVQSLYTSCQDMGNIQFYLTDVSTPVKNSAFIERGFKAGYALRNTSGIGLNSGGIGGEGATGGNGGNGGGGGGGSGYTDGSVTVLSTQLGGNSGAAKVIIRTA